MSTSAFDRLSQRVASGFLNTVVAVDDQAQLSISPEAEAPHALKNLRAKAVAVLRVPSARLRKAA
jgi:hypothetical protein